jgi:protein-S-isoprenylcysteine O-methyltransferase Ste14
LLISIASLPAILSMDVWSLIYHVRSITEERHLGRDPTYQEYMKKVKYRYIPKIY